MPLRLPHLAALVMLLLLNGTACKSFRADPQQPILEPLGSVRAEEPVRFSHDRWVRGERNLVDAAPVGDRLAVVQAQGDTASGALFLLDPFQLVPVGSLALAGPRAVAAAGSNVFVLGAGDALTVVACEPRAEPRIEQDHSLPGARCLAAGASSLAIVWENDEITLHELPLVVDAGPACTLALGSGLTTALAFGPRDTARYLYATTTEPAQLVVVDMENPSGPAVLRRLDAPAARRITVSGETLILAPTGDEAGGLLFYDLLEPDSPRLDGRIALPGARSAHLMGLRLFVLTEDRTEPAGVALRVWRRRL